jgi:yersiniabactin nonribosomal peptide/polyketide synthase
MENVLVPLIQSSSSERVFVFHASDGGVTPYLAFAQALDRNVWGLQAPEQITVNSLLELATGYLQAMKPQLGNEPYTLIGWSYGATVAAEVARMLHASGKDIRLVLIDPVYGADFTVADLSALMRLLAKEHGIALPDDWDNLDETSRIEVFMSGAVEAKVISQPMPVEVAQQWLSRIHQLLTLLSQHRVRGAIDIPILWIEADQHPEHWTPAVCEWEAWKVRAESHVVSATHWQLMEDAEISTQIATLVGQWSAQVSREEKIQ